MDRAKIMGGPSKVHPVEMNLHDEKKLLITPIKFKEFYEEGTLNNLTPHRD